MLTLNQIVRRIKTAALNHRQIKNVYFGNVTDFLVEKTTRYASLFLQDMPGNISLGNKTVSYPFKFFFLDLEHVSQDAKDNTLDVQSDMMQIATDLIAEFDFSTYDDWQLINDSPFVLVREETDDIVAGVAIDITIQVPYNKDTCSIPNLNKPETFELFWSWFAEDPYSDIQNEDFLFNSENTIEIKQYAMDFTAAAINQFIAVKEPAIEPLKRIWINTQLNNGSIPDQVFRDPVIIGDFRYYVSRWPVVIDSSNTIISFNV